MQSTDRSKTALTAANSLRSSTSRVPKLRAFVGFDGFIDSIIRVVDQRSGMGPDEFTALPTMASLAERIGLFAGKSMNLELVNTEDRFGGNGPLLAGGLAQFGVATDYLGCVGGDDDATKPHIVFAPFVQRITRTGGQVVPLCPPARTDALEFEDGKVMLGKPANLQAVTWDRIKREVGLERVRQMVLAADALGLVNWVMQGPAEGIWHGLCDEIFEPAAKGTPGLRGPRVFLDLCDPAKRTDADVRRALGTMRKLAKFVPVTLGLNLAEAQRIDAVSGAGKLGGSDGSQPSDERLVDAAEAIRASIGIDCVVIHPRHGAAGANAAGERAWFTGPLVKHPKLSTGAGDHFNAGFCLGQMLKLPLGECLAIGTATSGAYVRDANSPDVARLIALLADMPSPEA